MSLIRIALRAAVVKALKGRTFADDAVLDSQIGVLGEEGGVLTLPKKSKFIVVYTENAETSAGGFRDFYENGTVQLSLQFGVSDSMTVTEQHPDFPHKKIQRIIPGIAATGRAFEQYLDLMSRQIRMCLADGASEAADIVRSLILSFEGIQIERADSNRKGERVAAHNLTFKVVLLKDPRTIADVPEGSPLFRLLTLLEQGDQDEQKIASLIWEHLSQAPDETEQMRLSKGFSASEMSALGVHTASEVEQSLTDAVIDIEGHGLVEVKDD